MGRLGHRQAELGCIEQQFVVSANSLSEGIYLIFLCLNNQNFLDMYNNFRTLLWFSWIALASPVRVLSQQDTARILHISKTSEKIIIDGIDDEISWSQASQANQFINKWPLDTGLAILQSSVRLLYDDKNLYVFAKMYDRDNNLVIQSLKRDINPYYSEGFSIVLDPSGQKASGFTFGVNASGAQFDGIAQYNSASFEMDTKWYSA